MKDIINENLETKVEKIKIIKSKVKIKDTKLTALTAINIKIPKSLKIRLRMICNRTGLKQTDVLKQLIENCEIEGDKIND